MTVKQEVYRDVLQEGYLLHWYEVKSVLGRGAFGVTYLARDKNLDQLVAIKEYFPNDFSSRDTGFTVHPSTGEKKELFDWGLTRFIREAQTLAKFKHHNIVRVMSVFELNNTAYMVMEYEQGEELSKLYKNKNKLSEKELLDIFLPMLDGLKLVHDAGFIHRDIKPANIYIRDDGSPVLIDFGAARKTIGTPTRAVTSLVTHGYAPFEQYNESDDKQGAWTDIYALGACLYFAVNGKLPFDALVRGSSLLSDGADPYEPVSVAKQGDYSPGFLRAIDHALMFQAKNRPQDVLIWSDMLSGKIDVPPVPMELYKLSNRVIDEDATVILTSPPSVAPSVHQPTSGIPATEKLQKTQGPTSEIPATEMLQSTHGPDTQLPESRWKFNMATVAVLALSVVAASAIFVFRGGDESPVNQGESALQENQHQIATLLANADLAREEGKLLEPAVGAIYLYKQVLTIDPANALAANRIQEIVELYADGVRSDLAEGFHAKANSNIQLLQAAIPDSTSVLMLLEEVRASQTEQQSIFQLLQQAKADFNAGRLISPDDQNALSGYRRVLKKVPENTEARSGIDEIHKHFISLAKENLAKNDIVNAERNIENIFSIENNSVEGKKLSNELLRVKTQKAQQQKIAQLLSSAQQAFKTGKITQPTNKSALTFYRRVLKLEANNAQAKQGIQKVEGYMKSLFDKRMSAANFSSAESILRNVERSMPRSWLARKIRKEWERKKPKPKSDIDVISGIIAKFKQGFESRNFKSLKNMSEFKPNRQQFLQQVFNNYKSIKVDISDIKFIGSERKGVASIAIIELINIQGVQVEPGAWSRFEIVISRNAKGRWKVIW